MDHLVYDRRNSGNMRSSWMAVAYAVPNLGVDQRHRLPIPGRLSADADAVNQEQFTLRSTGFGSAVERNDIAAGTQAWLQFCSLSRWLRRSMSGCRRFVRENAHGSCCCSDSRIRFTSLPA